MGLSKLMSSKFITFLATGFYLGKSPKAPGTFGTLGAIPLWFIFSKLGLLGSIIMTLITIIVAIVVSDLYEKNFTEHDRPEIVIDEIAGYLVTMALLPLTLKWMILGFVLFRIFDIWKPYPISYLNDNVKGGLGVVIDDVAAGLVANILLQLLLQFGWVT
jgi:phosphatidylglycerophosphatase A